MARAEQFRAAVDQHDLAALEKLFTEDVRLYSPVKFTPFEGRAAVLGLFGVLLRTFEGFHYIGELEGDVEPTSRPSAEAPDTSGASGASGESGESGENGVPSAVLIFRATVGGREIHGMDLLQFDEAGLISEVTVMLRPLSAVQTVGEAVLRGLAADGLA
ncbi:nuclear transport factor 2 family protein [Yinghuangia soli]|uniref:Nuclear transport factor 2 family protein n=1 Tax=Yinghuangia soli TaxID=2908204 RepID=A0AA41U1G0_9ACTN|nr:nuclear transport factor 2 family protein [Yinghuangia soli]MCF2530758.1 nuclear transport factor 2 family protein [Yinghuangia soli]